MNSEISESRTPVHGEVHTPGPWKAWPVEHRHIGGMIENQIQIVSDPADGPVSHLATMVDCDGYSAETVRANARLIASAPELLEVAELFIAAWEETWIDPDETSLEWSDVYRKAKALVRSLRSP